MDMLASLDVSTLIETVKEEFVKEISKMLNDTKIAGNESEAKVKETDDIKNHRHI